MNWRMAIGGLGILIVLGAGAFLGKAYLDSQARLASMEQAYSELEEAYLDSQERTDSLGKGLIEDSSQLATLAKYYNKELVILNVRVRLLENKVIDVSDHAVAIEEALAQRVTLDMAEGDCTPPMVRTGKGSVHLET
jgi:hypothetical protein